MRGPIEEVGVEAAPLGAERQYRAIRQGARTQLITAGVERDEWTRRRRQVVEACDRQGEVQTGGTAQRGRVPRVVAAGGEHARGTGGCGDPHDGADIAQIARSLQQHQRRRGRRRKKAQGVDLRAACQRHDAGRRR